MTNIHELIRHLNNGQRADADGVTVTVSRHAVVEAIRLLNLLGETNEALAACQSQAGPCIKDAERYRWLRANNHYEGRVCIEIAEADDSCTVDVWHEPVDLDAAIDMACCFSREAMGVNATAGTVHGGSPMTLREVMEAEERTPERGRTRCESGQPHIPYSDDPTQCMVCGAAVTVTADTEAK